MHSTSFDANLEPVQAVQATCSTTDLQLSPSDVEVPLANTPGYPVDCVKWTQWLQGNNSYGYNEYVVSPITNLFNYPTLFASTGLSTAQLTDVQTALRNYLTACPPGACVKLASTCNPGFWGTGGADCASCYTQGANGVNCAVSQTCDAATGACSTPLPAGLFAVIATPYTSIPATPDYFGTDPTSTVVTVSNLNNVISNSNMPFQGSSYITQMTGYFIVQATGFYWLKVGGRVGRLIGHTDCTQSF